MFTRNIKAFKLLSVFTSVKTFVMFPTNKFGDFRVWNRDRSSGKMQVRSLLKFRGEFAVIVAYVCEKKEN